MRIAVGADLFAILLPEPTDSTTLPELASRCNAASDFTLRITRFLVTHRIIEYPQKDTCAHSISSKTIINNPSTQTKSTHIFDTTPMLRHTSSLTFLGHSWKSPTDLKDSPRICRERGCQIFLATKDAQCVHQRVEYNCKCSDNVELSVWGVKLGEQNGNGRCKRWQRTVLTGDSKGVSSDERMLCAAGFETYPWRGDVGGKRR